MDKAERGVWIAFWVLLIAIFGYLGIHAAISDDSPQTYTRNYHLDSSNAQQFPGYTLETTFKLNCEYVKREKAENCP